MLTHERLLEVVYYDLSTGIFTWIAKLSRKTVIGSRAGTIRPPRMYRVITIDGGKYYEHRLAWLYVTGRWPPVEIDHKNTVVDDNRFDNLREATGTQNQGNRNRGKNNTSGVKGVHFNKKDDRWQASISMKGRYVYLGQSSDLSEAAGWYEKAAKQYFKEFARPD